MAPRIAPALMSLALTAAPAAAIIIQGTELPPYNAVTNQLGVNYGAVFSSQNLPQVTFIELVPGTWGIQGTEPWAPPVAGYAWFNSPIYINFVDPANGVTPAVVNGTITFNWGDGGGDFDAIDVRAFDLANNLLSLSTFSGSAFNQSQVSGVGIHRLEFTANTQVGSPTSDTGIDWIDFPTPVVPAPAGLALLAIGGVLGARRRR